MTNTIDLTALFTDAVTSATHGRYAAKLTDADARRDAFGMRDAAAAEQAERERAAAERAARDASAAVDAHRAIIADGRAAWGDMADAERANDGAAYLLAAARAGRLERIALAPFDALAHTESGVITRAVRAYWSRRNAGETNRMLSAANVDAADVFNYAAELAIRDGATVGGMPTYAGMYRWHKRAAGLLRRDAFAGRAGYVTVSADDLSPADSDALRADILGRGIAHVRPAAPTPVTVAEILASARITPPADAAAHAAAIADAHREESARKRAATASREHSARRAAAWIATPPVTTVDDSARIGSAVVQALATGATFEDIRAVFDATDTTLTRYAYAAANVRRATVNVERNDSESLTWSAYLANVHTLRPSDDCEECRNLAAAKVTAERVAAERRRRERAARLAADARENATPTPRVHRPYSDAPALPEFTPWIISPDDVEDRRDAAVDHAARIERESQRKADAVVAAATTPSERAAAKRRAARIIASAAELVEEIMRHAASFVSTF